jgi:hypothetical protein
MAKAMPLIFFGEGLACEAKNEYGIPGINGTNGYP